MRAFLARWERLALPAAMLAAAAAYLLSYALDPRRPRAAALSQGWWTFSDQGRYLRSTLAWAAGNLAPSEHWYLPGYPLLAAPFVHVTPANPFLLPDLALLLACLWMVAALAGRLAPGWRHARLAGALAFLGTSVLPPWVLNVWVTPWSSTPQTALTLGALLATLAFVERLAPQGIGRPAPRGWLPVLAAALCAAGIAAFRPSDAVTVSAVCGTAILLRLLTAWPGLGAALRLAAVGLLGGGAVVGALLGLYWLIYGWRLSEYLDYSFYLGFEWRILPLQWVQIVLDSRPLLPESNGLVARLPWIVPGLAGMAACLVSPPFGGRRAGHALVVGLVAAHMVQYLAYRDLHPQGLWRYYNFHYFKWVLPVFGLYAVFAAAALVQRRWLAAGAGLAALALLLPWRAELAPVAVLPPQAGKAVFLPAGLTVWDALLVPADGSWEAIYHGSHNTYYGGDDRFWFGATGRLVTDPVPGGFMLVPFFAVPDGPGKIVLDQGVAARADAPVRLIRQRLVYGLPCFLSTRLHRLPACAVGPWITP